MRRVSPYAHNKECYSDTLDLEAQTLPTRCLQQEHVHLAPRNAESGTPRNEEWCGLFEGSGTSTENQHLLTQVYGNDAPLINATKKAILTSQNTSDLLDAAENHIEEDWLGPIDELPGNVYRIAAFGRMFYFDDNTSILTNMYDISRIVGCTLIWLIQISGPPFIVISYMTGIGITEDKTFVMSEWKIDLSDWTEMYLTKLMSMLFIMAFCMNGAFVVLDERQSWDKMNSLFRYLEARTTSHMKGEAWLYLDAFTNCWTILWCSFATLIVIGPAETPKDVVFDALGLLFLYNLDDIGGDFGFVNTDDWPGLRLGWIFRHMVKENWPKRDSNESRTMSKTLDLSSDNYEANPVVVCMYSITAYSLFGLAIALPIVAALSSFSTFVPDDAV